MKTNPDNRCYTPMRLGLLPGLLLSCFASANAAEPLRSGSEQDQPKVVVPSVEVTARADEYDPRRDDTASKTVINQDDIGRYGDTNVYDILKRAPGVTVIGSSIRMRGLGNGYTQILVNGERPPPGFSMEALPPEQIERIEIIRAATAEFSMQAIAGTINVVLKRVVTKPQRDLRLTYTRSDEKQSRAATGTAASRFGPLSYTVTGIVSREDRSTVNTTTDKFTIPGGDVSQMRDTRTDRDARVSIASLQPRLNWKLDDNHQLNAIMVYQRITIDNHDVGVYTNRIGTFSVPDYVHDRQQLTNNSSSAFGELNLISKLWGGKLDAKISQSGQRGTEDSDKLSGTADDIIELRRLKYTSGTLKQTAASAKYSIGVAEGHALSTGFELKRQRTSIADRRLEGLAGMDPLEIEESFSPAVTNLAAFAQDEWKLSPQWSMYLGTRWEGIRTRSADQGQDELSTNTYVLTPVAQTLYKFPDRSGRQVRMALTRTFKAPTLSQLIVRRERTAQNTRFTPDQGGNPALRPELADGLDLTYEHFWAPGAIFSANTSVRRIRNYIRNRLDQDEQGLWLIRPINDGNARTRSLELELKFPLKAVMQGVKVLPIDLRANVNRNWSQVQSVPGPNNRLDQQVPLTAALGADYKGQKISVGAYYSISKGSMVRVSPEQSNRLHVRRSLDGYFQYKITPSLDWRLSLGNALGYDTIGYQRYQDGQGVSESWSRTPSSLELRLNIGIKL